MKNLFLLFILSVFTFSLQAQGNTKKQDIEKLLVVTGSAEMGVQMAKNMLENFKMTYSQVETKFWNEAAKEFKSRDLVELIVPIYDKYFTHEEIKGLLAFYETPLGQKTIQQMPFIMQESMAAGEEWGRRLSEKVVAKLREKGYLD